MQNYKNGQQLGLKNNLVCICLEQLANASAPYKQWLTLCLAQLWSDYDKARWVGVRDIAHEKLYILLEDKVPEVSWLFMKIIIFLNFQKDITVIYSDDNLE